MPSVTLFDKLWDKGVDIAAAVIASTISAGIVALIATLTWRWNKRRDLTHEEAKQLQQHRIETELAATAHARARAEENVQIREECETLARQAETIATQMSGGDGNKALANLWTRYLDVLVRDPLTSMPRNVHVFTTTRQWPQALSNEGADARKRRQDGQPHQRNGTPRLNLEDPTRWPEPVRAAKLLQRDQRCEAE